MGAGLKYQRNRYTGNTFYLDLAKELAEEKEVNNETKK
jgi:hypothetical protein